MAGPAFPTGMLMGYGGLIAAALRSKGTTLGELTLLRDQVRETVAAQGNLVEALRALDEAIAARSPKDGPPRPRGGAAAAEQLLVRLEGIGLPAEARGRIEAQLREIILRELASVDAAGRFEATPLAEVKSWGAGGIGGATAGLVVARV